MAHRSTKMLDHHEMRRELIQARRDLRRLSRGISCADPLTGLPLVGNFGKDCIVRMRKVVEKRQLSLSNSEHVHRRNEREKHCVVFVDLDGLQWTNNDPNHGYRVGDHIIIMLARILNRWRRGDDLIFRRSKGGDEFILFYPCATENDTIQQIMLMNRRRFEKDISERFPGLAGKVSFTFGVQEVSVDDSESRILEALDYAGKNMHVWKERRKMDRRVTNLLGENGAKNYQEDYSI